LASPLPQAEAHRPAQAAQPTRALGVIAEVRFLLGLTSFALGAFSLPTADMGDLLVSSVFPTALADPGRETSAPPLPASPALRLGCHQDFTAPQSSFPPLIPFKPSLNGLNGYSPPAVTLATPPAPSPGPIKATPTTPGAPHTSPRPSPLLFRAGNPPH
jgi:hypothetical protein